MAKVEIQIEGKALPCRQTMGAMLRFKRETGKEVTEIAQNSISDVCTYLWCCVVSACKHDGIDFDMSLIDFADSISSADLMAWSTQVAAENEANAEQGEKKSL